MGCGMQSVLGVATSVWRCERWKLGTFHATCHYTERADDGQTESKSSTCLYSRRMYFVAFDLAIKLKLSRYREFYRC
jgi:hypothetical protein